MCLYNQEKQHKIILKWHETNCTSNGMDFPIISILYGKLKATKNALKLLNENFQLQYE